MSHNIYSNQWLDQVFETQNKNYGAYDLRMHASENTTRGLLLAIAITASIVTLPFVAALLKVNTTHEIDLEDHVHSLMEVPEIILPKTVETIAAASAHQKSKEIIKPEIIKDNKIVDDKKQIDFDIKNNDTGTTSTGTGKDNDTLTNINGNETNTTINAVDTNVYLGGIEIMPEFPGGEQAMLNFLASRLKYPRQWADNNIKGTVYISFVIDKEGSVTSISTLRGISVSKDFENEAKRVVAQMPKWKAGIQNGKNVSVYFTLPVSFSIK
jgi:protein TonB